MPVFRTEKEYSTGKYKLLHGSMLLPFHGLPSPFSEHFASRTTIPALENSVVENIAASVVPIKSDSDVILCLQLLSKNTNVYASLELTRIDRSLVY